MCQMRIVVLRDKLGNRELCWSLFDGKQIVEMTSKMIKDTIEKGHKVCGLKIGSNGELELDKAGFFCNNIMEHRHCGNYKAMYEENCMTNIFYVAYGSHVEDGKMVYDCISTRFEQAKISEADMRAYLKIGIISAGAKLDGDKIVLADLEYPKKEEVTEGSKAVTESEKVEDNKMAEPEKETKAEENKVSESAKTESKEEIKKEENPLNDRIVSVEKTIVKTNKSLTKK